VTAKRIRLGLLLAAVPLASGCGGVGARDVVSIDPVARAATRTSGQLSMCVAFGGTVTGPWVGERVGFTGTGVVTAGGTAGMYMRSRLFAKLAPASTSWLKVDLARVAARRGIDLDARSQMKQVDPRLALGYLAGGGRPRELGWDRLRDGELVQRYGLTIDLRRLFERHVELRRLLPGLPGFARSLPAQAWVDGRGYLRKLMLTFSLARTADGPVQMTMTEEFSGFGVAAHVVPPPANRVTDATRILNRG
jgi:hypothetical protein